MKCLFKWGFVFPRRLSILAGFVFAATRAASFLSLLHPSRRPAAALPCPAGEPLRGHYQFIECGPVGAKLGKHFVDIHSASIQDGAGARQ